MTRIAYLVLVGSVVACGIACGGSSAPHPDLATPDLATPDLTTPEPDLAMPDAATTMPIIASFTASPSVIPAGTTTQVTLTWSVTDATSLSISGIGAVTGTSTIVPVSATTTFTLTATDADAHTATATAMVALDDGTLGVYVDPTNGSDTANTGKPASPYKTINKAASVATSGKSIYLAVGNYAAPADFNGGNGVTIPNGVSVVPLGNGTTFTGAPSNAAIIFAGSGSLSNVKIASFTAGVKATTGTVTLSGLQFTGGGDGASGTSCLMVSGTAVVRLTPGGLTDYVVAPSQNFANVSGAGQLEIDGGAVSGLGSSAFSGAWTMATANTAKLTLNGVTMTGNQLDAIQASDQSTVTVKGGTTITNNAAVSGGNSIKVNGNPTVLIDASTISLSASSPASASIIYSTNLASATLLPVITVQNGSTLSGSLYYGIASDGATLTVASSTISGNKIVGVQLSAGSLTTSAGTVISGNGKGVNLSGNVAYQVMMRGTKVINNTQDGVIGIVGAGSTLDFGQATAAGGNTFSGNGAGAPAASNMNLTAYLSTANLVATAVGNTWDPTANGATNAGLFATTLTLSAPPTVMGKNVQLSQQGTATENLELVLAP